MKKVIETRTEITKIEVTAHFCDICENQLGEQGVKWLYEETARIEFNFGYLSDNKDGDQGNFILCQNCAHDLHNHLETLSPNFKLNNYTNYLADSYSEDTLNEK